MDIQTDCVKTERVWDDNITRQAMYVQRNIEARSRNHCCRGKAISITYSVSVCSLSYPACKAPYIFPHYPTKDTIFGKILLNIKHVF
jgi:hypothetical protein